MRNIKSLFLINLTLCLSLVFPLNAEAASYAYLSSLNKESFILGDVLKVNANSCWSVKNPNNSLARKRLEIFVSGNWKSVGKVQFIKSKSCFEEFPKYPYAQVFMWEVDRLGTLDQDGLKGTLRLRHSVNKPTEYAKIFIYESEEAMQEAREQRKADASAIIECELFSNGQWDSTRKICVGKPGS